MVTPTHNEPPHRFLHLTSHQSPSPYLLQVQDQNPCPVYSNGILLGRVLIDGCYSTRFNFVISHCTKFGVTITQLVLGYIPGFLTDHCRGGRCTNLLYLAVRHYGLLGCKAALTTAGCHFDAF